ncbi:DUF2213 domain-containing protein [Clostridium neonatale]|uniref:DUF2213 domain-containing protein n=1 Tax=Clostridium neonatale TaxID=137838 RepID=UPI002069FE12|nr:conserved hypothetical protein [Clostridium neonatale]DAH65672.1 MAG TPA: hypothetical protein [Caudoviricetes sp.]
MKAYYGSRFSPNMTRTPENFLICHNVPIARTGWYDYLASELGVGGNEIVKVYRSPEEVFSKSAIASFEGKPVTDEHPPDLLTPQNVNMFLKGTAQNVRQDTKEPDLLVGDLIIYDSVLIDEINQGKREVSCGYECQYKDNGDGTYSQVGICGNHVAVVEAGRAGDRVAINDSEIKKEKGEKKKMAKKKVTKSILQAIGLKHYLADAEPEEVADALNEISEGCDEDPTPQEQTPANDEGGNSELAALNAKMDKLIALLSNGAAPKAEDEEPESAIDELINTLEKGKETTAGDEEESVTVPAEQMSDEDIPDGVVQSQEELPTNPIPNADSAAMLMALKAVRPIIAAIPDKKAKQKACDSVMAQFKSVTKKSQNKNSYAAIMQAQKSAAVQMQKATDAAEAKMKAIEDGYKKQNPHYKEVK